MKKRRVKRKLKVGRILLVVLVSLIVIGGALFGIKYLLKSDNKPITKPKEEEKEKLYTASVITAGDNLIHSSVYKDANKNANYNGYDFKPMYEYIKPIVSEYDIAYYNQETILGGTELGLGDYPTFNSPYEVGDAMVDAGFNLVSLATNHTMDSGEKAILNSRNYWNSRDNVLAVGSYSSMEERNEVQIRETKNITYTMLNYTYGTNGIRVPSGKEYLVNVWPTDIDNINDPERDTKYQAYKDTVKEDIDRVRDKVDVLIVAMHWGVEYTHEPTKYEKDMAQFLADNGVDVIIGTHPHVVQPVTYIGDTLVIYSLGNFISAQYQNQGTCTNYKCMVGAMTSFNITKTVKSNDKSIKISDVSTELVYTYYSGWRNFKVVPFSNEKIKDYLPSYKNVYETYKEVIQKFDSSMEVVPAYE
ncbi:MAG: CapA family protein [Bacilli bacterium]